MKKFLICFLIIFSLFIVGCRKEKENEIRYLNFKPEIATVYQEIANKYEEKTGVKVIVETAASGSYESTLQARMGTSMAPTIFQINGPVGYSSWKDYCLDLKETKLYNNLIDKDNAIKSGEGIYGIGYVVEGYGIIYNKEITDKYFSSSWKSVAINSIEEIKSFEMFKKVVEDMQLHKDKLGIEGVFASTSLKTGEDWRWQTHLFNAPLSYEISEGNITDYSKLEFKYLDKYKQVFDLYLDNSSKEKGKLGTVTVSDSMAEFALGKCAMVQNGNWAASQVLGVSGNVVKSENIKFMPIFSGHTSDETQGLYIGTENFICINAKASKEKQKLAIDFLEWLYLSDEGKEIVIKKLKFITPFEGYDYSESITDPLALEVIKWMNNKDVKNVGWNFTIIPSLTFKEDFGSNLLKYAQGKTTWEEVTTNLKNKWKSEWDLMNK